jgi:Pectate lyase superfamily protein
MRLKRREERLARQFEIGLRGCLLVVALGLLMPVSLLRAQTKTTVTDTIHAPDGSLPNGQIIISASSTFTAADGTVVFQGTVATATVANGVFSVALVPNTGSVPAGTSYRALYELSGVGYRSETWVVPGSSSPVNLAAVRSVLLSSPSAMVAATQLPSVIDASAIHDKGGQVFNVKAYGAVGDGTTDDTAAFNAALNAVVANHGGTIYVPPSPTPYILDPDWTMPNDGAPNGAAFANQYPIKIQGAVTRQSQANGTETNTYDTTSGSMIEFKAAATNGDIVTLGQGNLEISGVTFITTTCSPFIWDTQTTLRIYDNQFVGSGETPTSCNDAIVLGGTSTTAGALSPTLNFGGFGTIIRGNTFKGIRRMVLAQTYADDWFLEKNTYSNTSGNSSYCAVEINDPGNNGSLGGYVENDRFEMPGALCAMKAVNATTPVFAFNDLEDFGGTPVATSVVDLTNTTGAQIYSGFDGPPTSVPYVKAEDSASKSYNFINNSSSSSIPSVLYSLQVGNLQMQNAGGLASYDASGNKIDSTWQSTGNYYERYTPNGGSTTNLWGFTVNGSSIGSFYMEGSSQNFFRGEGSLYNYFLADSGWALLGNAADHFALGVDPADGSLKVDKWQRLVPHTFATYPVCSSSTEGDQAAINDSTTATWGATITGAGTNHVLGYCDGTNWTVAAK